MEVEQCSFCRREWGLETVVGRLVCTIHLVTSFDLAIGDRRYCLMVHPHINRHCVLRNGHGGPHRAMDKVDSKWIR